MRMRHRLSDLRRLSNVMVAIMPWVMNMYRRREPRERPARKDHQDGKSAKHEVFRNNVGFKEVTKANANTPRDSTRWMCNS